MGTFPIKGLLDTTEDITSEDTTITQAIAAALENEEIKGVTDDLLNVHGIVPGPKPEGVTRLIYENPYGFNTRISNNDKLDKAKELIDEVGADIVAYSEHQINAAHKENVNGMSQMFNGGEAEIRSVTGHNVHENVGRRQQGGTSLILYGSMIDYYDFKGSGKVDTGLGRWVHMVFRGSYGIVTRVVCGYNP